MLMADILTEPQSYFKRHEWDQIQGEKWLKKKVELTYNYEPNCKHKIQNGKMELK